jgi:hypothetical protein
MAFTDFKSIAQVQTEYHIKYQEKNFIDYLESIIPSDFFLKEFEFNQEHIDVFTSEASRCENVIYPIIREVYKNFVDKYTIWSHKSIKYDNKLTGTPDYMISTKSELGKTVLGLPVLAVVEAKQNNFIEGWAQCLAELIAIQKINENEEIFVYGIVTDGELWQFGRLQLNIFTKHKARIAITDLNRVFGAIGYLLSQC